MGEHTYLPRHDDEENNAVIKTKLDFILLAAVIKETAWEPRTGAI